MSILDSLCGIPCASRTVGIVTSFTLLLGGLATAITLHALCLIIGLYMILAGLIVGMIEAPALFECMDLLRPIAARLKAISHFAKFVLFICLTVPNFFCIGLSSLLAAAFLFFSAFLYFLQWLGPRGAEAKGTAVMKRSGEGEDDVQVLLENEADVPKADEIAMEEGTAGDEVKPWEKFMSGVGEAVGKTAASLAVAQMAAQASNTTAQGGAPPPGK